MRFRGNARFDDDAITHGFVAWIWHRFGAWKTIPISIDWTHDEKRDKWTTLVGSVTLNGRGISAMMWSLRKGDYDEHLSRSQCEKRFVKHLMQHLPQDDRIVLMADRGFARVNFFKWLDEQNTH